jgi:transposase-like protein
MPRRLAETEQLRRSVRRLAERRAQVEAELRQGVAAAAAAGVPIAELARDVGVSRQSVYNWIAERE